ncbi:Ribosome maturation factor rimM [Rickettsiales bacterium Ac37b]|nr:Ribosome maturation factor rimM [Rickettsiales bacterium Ac37b]
MSKRSEYTHIGNIIAAHGIKGEVKIQNFAAKYENILSFKQFYDNYGNKISLKFRLGANNKIIASVGNVNTRNQAEKLIGTKLFIERKEIESLQEEEYLHEELIGLRVLDQNKLEWGIIKSIHNFGAGDLIEVIYNENNDTNFFPFTKEVIIEINILKGYLILIPPEMV